MTRANEVPRVVIVGGGFGGLYAARALADAPLRVTVVDRRNYHLFQPLLYQVATASLNPSDIAAPIRAVLRKQENADVILGEVTAIDRTAKRLVLADGMTSHTVDYDKLILATGATHSYFGRDDWALRAPGLKTVEDALEIRRRLFFAYEAAEREPDHRAAWLNFVIVGAGPTGVELAGALAEISRRALKGDFRHIDPAEARVLLLEGASRVLPTYPDVLSREAERDLRSLGAEVQTGARVVAIDDEGVTVERRSAPERPPVIERIPSFTVIWAAGVAASPLAKSLDVPLDRAGRVLVRPDLSIPGDGDVFVIGDLASLESDGLPVPGVAPAAIQEGRHAARNITRSLVGQPTEPFHYSDRGTLATIGRAAAVGVIKGVHLSGFVAWCAWLLVHIMMLIGFRNRAVVILEWAFAYVSNRKGARLITGSVPRLSHEGATHRSE
jgi:NADH dehydrogenase